MTLALSDRLDLARADLPAVRRGGYFNSGFTGPLCRPARDAMAATADREWEHGRMGPGRTEALLAQAEARALVAELIGAPAAEVALTQHTTEGVNAVTLGLPWRPGDNAVTTQIEHKGVLLPLGALRDRHGVEVRPVPWSPRLIEDVVAAIDDRTRLVALSHVSYVTGAVLDLAPVVETAHRHGALVLVDGAQSAGVLPVDVAAIGADAYTVSGQKWLCGPEGSGALHVRADALDRIAPAVLGWASVTSFGLDGSYEPNPDSSRFEVGTRSRPVVDGFAAAIRWLRDDVGLPWAYERTYALAERLRSRLTGGLTPDEHVGLVTFRPHVPAAVVVAQLAELGSTVRSVPGYDCVRASVGWFHTEAEVDELAAQIDAVLR
jgi:L-cysteine/cystine lyase